MQTKPEINSYYCLKCHVSFTTKHEYKRCVVCKKGKLKKLLYKKSEGH